MLISLNEIKKYVEIPAGITDQDLITLIGSRLVEIEEAINLAPKYKGIYIAKVVSAEKIPDTHLTLCQIDAGEHNAKFNQLENGLVQVVCGAPNVRAGMLVAWLAPAPSSRRLTATRISNLAPASYRATNLTVC